MENTSQMDSEVINMVQEFTQGKKWCFTNSNLYNKRISNKLGELESLHALFKVGMHLT